LSRFFFGLFLVIVDRKQQSSERRLKRRVAPCGLRHFGCSEQCRRRTATHTRTSRVCVHCTHPSTPISGSPLWFFSKVTKESQGIHGFASTERHHEALTKAHPIVARLRQRIRRDESSPRQTHHHRPLLLCCCWHFYLEGISTNSPHLACALTELSFRPSQSSDHVERTARCGLPSRLSRYLAAPSITQRYCRITRHWT